MTKYEIKTDCFEFRFGTAKSSVPEMSESDVFNDYLDGACNDPVIEASFDKAEDAIAVFNSNYRNYAITKAEKGSVFWLLRGQVAWIEQNDYDDDGEFDQGGDVIDYAAERYEAEEEDE